MDGDGDFIQLFEPIIDFSPFTIEVWALMFSPGGGVYRENCMFEQRSKGTGFGAATVTLLAKNAHEDEASFELRDSASDRIKLAGPIQNLMQWHHYAGVVSDNVIKFYIDGYLVSSFSFQFSGTFNDGIDNIDIGRHACHNIVAGYFNGFIDEMRIWNYARSENEIRAGMHTVVDLEDREAMSRLLAYWRFDDFYEFWKDGVQYVGVKDLSGNEHHGAFVDDAWLKPADESPRIVPLVDFDLLSPPDGSTVYTDSPMLRWQSATTAEHLLNNELTYFIFVDAMPTFDSPLELTTFGNQTSVWVSDLQDGDYYWTVKARNGAGEEKWSNGAGQFHVSILTGGPTKLSEQFVLWRNYPNPFNPQTTIRFYLPFESNLSVIIYDVHGRIVKTALDGLAGTGMYSYTWRGENEDGDAVSAGVYFYKVVYTAPDGSQCSSIKKMTLLK